MNVAQQLAGRKHIGVVAGDEIDRRHFTPAPVAGQEGVAGLERRGERHHRSCRQRHEVNAIRPGSVTKLSRTGVAEQAMSAGDPSVILSALDWLEEGRRVALATVIQTWGSAPRPVGSQLVIDGGGNFLGSVSGGCVEGEVIAEAAQVLLTAKPKTFEFGVEDGTAWKAGLACGGTIRIFVEPVEEGSGEGTGVLHQL